MQGGLVFAAAKVFRTTLLIESIQAFLELLELLTMIIGLPILPEQITNVIVIGIATLLVRQDKTIGDDGLQQLFVRRAVTGSIAQDADNVRVESARDGASA